MTWFVIIAAISLSMISLSESRADGRRDLYAQNVRCDKSALTYYNETEQPKNTANSHQSYESYFESNYKESEDRCVIYISSMMHRYRENKVVWSSTLVYVDNRIAFGTLIKSIDLVSNKIDYFKCDVAGETCSSKDEFMGMAKPYLEN